MAEECDNVGRALDGNPMHISINDAGTTATVVLEGKLDITGADAVAPVLTRLSEQKLGLIVDLSGVSFLASIGIRQLTAAARSLTRRGGRMVLLKPAKLVEEVLTVSAVDSLIPIARSDKEAQAVLAAALSG
jgi:anti-sigma B factor antagonist